MEMEGAVPVSGGFFGDSYVAVESGKKVFYKFAKKGVFGTIRSIESRLFKPLLYSDPLKKHMLHSASNGRQLEKEVMTWGLWKEEGIEVPNLICGDARRVKYEFVEGSKPYTKILAESEEAPEFDRFLEVYDRIRKLAKKKKDPNYFHSDPHLGNFIYSAPKDIALPIDAGTVLNPSMSFEELDTQLIGFTLRSFSDLELGKEKTTKYLRRFREILTPQDVDRVLEVNYKLPFLAAAYLGFREEVAHRVKRRPKNDLVEKHRIFLDNFNWMKEALQR
jgi:hypothetical protein